MGCPLRLLVQGSRESTRIALLDETRLLEFYQEDTGTESLVGSVFLGRVERVLPDVKAAFCQAGACTEWFFRPCARLKAITVPAETRRF